MWARISEILIGIWLIFSHYLLKSDLYSDLICGLLFILLAGLSFIGKINKMHLLEALPAFWLLYLGYTYPTPWLPMYMQNILLSALTILMFAVLPSRSSDHPRAWKQFLKEKNIHK